LSHTVEPWPSHDVDRIATSEPRSRAAIRLDAERPCESHSAWNAREKNFRLVRYVTAAHGSARPQSGIVRILIILTYNAPCDEHNGLL